MDVYNVIHAAHHVCNLPLPPPPPPQQQQQQQQPSCQTELATGSCFRGRSGSLQLKQAAAAQYHHLETTKLMYASAVEGIHQPRVAQQRQANSCHPQLASF
jgi:hypothetical protein